MKLQSFVIIKSYKRFLTSEHSRGLRMGCLGKKCFVHDCDVEGPLYPVGDDRYWCGMCEKHADMRKSYRLYLDYKLNELKLMLDFDNMLYEEDY